MDFVYDSDRPEIIPWAEKRVGDVFHMDKRGIAAIRDDGEIAAVAVWDHRTAWNINVNVASDGSRRWLSRAFLFAVFAYPFLQVGAFRCTTVVAVGNAAALRLNQKVGFTIEGRLRDANPLGDAFVLGMTRRECRWIGNPDAEVRRAA